MTIRLLAGDCRDVLATLDADSLDACVTDPPYHLTSGNVSVDWGAMSERSVAHGGGGPKGPTNSNGRGHTTGFMGKTWDGGGVAFDPETWRAVYRVLKPGAHLLAFGGTRTQHRMVCAIEDAGFEIRDTVCWLYGSGFPKSLDVSKAMDRAAGAEREVVGTKLGLPGYHLHGHDGGEAFGHGLASTTYETRLASSQVTAPATPDAARWAGWGTALKPAHEPIVLARKPLSERTVAANVLRWSTGALNIDASRIGTTVETWPLSRSYAPGQIQPGGKGETQATGDPPAGRWPANVCHDGSPEVLAAFDAFGGTDRVDDRGTKSSNASLGYHGGTSGHDATPVYADTGSAARFFYCAKADSGDRADSRHPTVKPVDLLRWLVRLITPPGGTCLDPFAGSGTTAEAAMLEGFDAFLIERDVQHCADIRHRIARWSGLDAPLFALAAD